MRRPRNSRRRCNCSSRAASSARCSQAAARRSCDGCPISCAGFRFWRAFPEGSSAWVSAPSTSLAPASRNAAALRVEDRRALGFPQRRRYGRRDRQAPGGERVRIRIRGSAAAIGSHDLRPGAVDEELQHVAGSGKRGRRTGGSRQARDRIAVEQVTRLIPDDEVRSRPLNVARRRNCRRQRDRRKDCRV